VRGETVYDLKKAIKKNALVSHFYEGKPKALADMLCKVKPAIAKRYLKIVEPEGHPLGYVTERAYFGDIKGKRWSSAPREEIWHLVLVGENLKAHEQRLSSRYHLPYKIIEDEWNKAKEQPKGLSSEQMEALRKLERFPNPRSSKKTSGPTYERRFKNPPRDWRTLSEGAVVDFLKPYYSDPLALLNQGRILKTPSASYRKVPGQATRKIRLLSKPLISGA
jgi:hypothetical protein